MLGKTVADTGLAAESDLRGVLDALGSPMMALLLATLVAMFTLGRGSGISLKEVAQSLYPRSAPIARSGMLSATLQFLCR
jgi:gluconate:H+ symporter, GntP family